MRRQCTQCGSSLVRSAAFCHRCGTARPHDEDVAVATTRRRRTGQPLRIRDRGDTPEREVWRGTFSAKGLIHQWLLAVAVTVALPCAGWAVQIDRETWQIVPFALILPWAGLIGWLLLLKLDVHYSLTNQRLIHKRGILTRHSHRIEVIDIDDVSYRQSIIERVFRVGTIEIISSDASDPVIELPGIDRVDQVAQVIDEARRAERVRRGIHIEAV